MNGAVPPVDYPQLRRTALDHAQKASGEIWTDYNLHDPGVTFLEQTCFALTELVYRADMPVGDLLTAADGTIDYEGLALFGPDRVMPTDPVTRNDVAVFLAQAKGVARITVHPGVAEGLYDLVVVPEAGVTDGDACAAVRARFAAHRPLARDIGRLRAARAIPARLDGAVAVRGGRDPEPVAAAIHYHLAQALRGEAAAGSTGGATRTDVFEAPMRFHGPAAADAHDTEAPDAAEIVRRLPDVEDIVALGLETPEGAPLPGLTPPEADAYYALELPAPHEPVKFRLLRDGAPLALDPQRLRHEIGLIRADAIARSAPVLDMRDWTLPQGGRRRAFGQPSVNLTLPALYLARPEPRGPGEGVVATAAARQLAGYRGIVDAVLAAMGADLAHLPELFSAGPDVEQSYWSGRAAAAEDFGLVSGATGIDDAVAEGDDWIARRQRVLDYLLALQGEELPQDPPSLDIYRSRSARRTSRIERSARLLAALPEINRARGSGPSAEGPGGLLRKFCLMADLPDPPETQLSGVAAAAGLRIAPAGAASRSTVERTRLVLPYDPLDMLVPVRDPAGDVDAADLFARSPRFAGGGIDLETLRRGVEPDAWVASPAEGGRWRLLLDDGAGGPLGDGGTFDDRSAAVEHANALRCAITRVNRLSEGAYLVEDVLLRQNPRDFEPFRAWLVVTGWTARTCRDDYRAFAGELLRRLVPAHVAIDLHWLDSGGMARFETLHSAWRADPGKGAALRDFLHGLGGEA